VVIDAELRAAIEADCERYPVRRGGLLPALHRVQSQLGCISREAVVELAEIFGLRPIEVLELVSFYNMFHGEPRGRHQVFVCTNLPCSLRGARVLLRQLEEHLGIRCGESTPDGRIHLGHEECLGGCGYAPMMRIGDDYHEDLDVERAIRILDALE